jgi:tRNA A-37 threonylcarbamoyl transferase component Bud32
MFLLRDLRAGGVSWQVHPDLLDNGNCSLFGPEGLRLPEWQVAGQARLIKRGADRTVYRVVLPGIDFYLKQYRSSGIRARLRDWLRPSKARIECRHILSLAEKKVPTPEVLAVGETESGGRPASSFLLTRTVPEVTPLGTFLETTFREWPDRRQTPFRQRLAVALGKLLARMHDAGVTHRDLHAGNLLLRLTPDDGPELYLIDLHLLRCGEPLDARKARAGLITLNRWFILRSERSDRLRFWRAYQDARCEGTRCLTVSPPKNKLSAVSYQLSAPIKIGVSPSETGEREECRHLEKQTLASNLRFWRRHDRNCLGNNRYFCRVRRSGVAGHAVADLSGDVLAELLADPDAPFRRPDGVVLKNSPSSAVVEFDLPGTGGLRRVIYKRFTATRWADPWTALVRPTPALRSYVLGHGLRLRCLPTPRPLGVWHRRRRGLLRDGYLLTEKVQDARDLITFVKDLGALPPDDRRRELRRMIDQAAALVRDLHHRRLSHRDLKAPNLLTAPTPSSHGLGSGEGLAAAERGARWMFAAPRADAAASYQVWFIDLVGVTRHGKLRRSRRVQNLARLHASFCNHPGLTRSDKLRFLRVYLRWGLRGRTGWKRWWREIAEATREKVQRNLRNGRPLG